MFVLEETGGGASRNTLFGVVWGERWSRLFWRGGWGSNCRSFLFRWGWLASCSQNFLFGGGWEGGSLVAIVTLGANQGSWNLGIVYFECVFTLLLIISNSGLESFSLIFDWVYNEYLKTTDI